MNRLPPAPPSYLYHSTCAVCWEGFGCSMFGDWFDRWRHRRKWGHDPVDLHPRLTEEDRHERMVRAAEEWRRHRLTR